MSNWHERGELPPVGEHVLLVGSGESLNNELRLLNNKMVYVICHSVSPASGKPVAIFGAIDSDGCSFYHGLPAECFRPIIKSDRDRAIWAAYSAVSAKELASAEWQAHAARIFDQLYDAGVLRAKDDAQ